MRFLSPLRLHLLCSPRQVGLSSGPSRWPERSGQSTWQQISGVKIRRWHFNKCCCQSPAWSLAAVRSHQCHSSRRTKPCRACVVRLPATAPLRFQSPRETRLRGFECALPPTLMRPKFKLLDKVQNNPSLKQFSPPHLHPSPCKVWIPVIQSFYGNSYMRHKFWSEVLLVTNHLWPK